MLHKLYFVIRSMFQVSMSIETGGRKSVSPGDTVTVKGMAWKMKGMKGILYGFQSSG